MRILFVDDLRKPNYDEWECSVSISKTYINAIQRLKEEGPFDIIDLDHDLGEEKTGYDIAKYIVENNIPIKAFTIHSMNPVGVKNIRELLTHYGYKEI